MNDCACYDSPRTSDKLFHPSIRMFRACFGGALLERNGQFEVAAQIPLGNVSAAQGTGSSGGLINAVPQTPPRRDGSPALTGGTSSTLGEPSATGNPATTVTLCATPTLNATRIQDMRPENVSPCDALQIMEGLSLQHRLLGRGTYGVVLPGTYRGLSCAVKIMLCNGLERAAVHELLLSPRLVHPNVVLTYASRCAPLTDAFFDLLEGERSVGRGPNRPRVLEPVPLRSDDGFGDPKDLHDGHDSLLVLHHVLHSLGAETGKMMVVVIQERCNRGTLDGAIRKRIFQPTQFWGVRVARRAVIRTAAEMARGLLHMHELGVVHGDVKPANVLLNTSKEDRRGFTSKVGDFGLAHVLPVNATSLDTDCWGSIAYMAPEALNGRVSRATDVWAFGVCLWEMLTGQRPYGGMHYSEVVAGVREGRLHLPWPEDEPFTDGLIALGRCCLNPDPKMRPRMDVVIQALVDIERAIRAELLANGNNGAAPQQQQQQQQHPAPAVPTAMRQAVVSAPGGGGAAAAAAAAGGLSAYPAAPLSHVAGDDPDWDMIFL